MYPEIVLSHCIAGVNDNFCKKWDSGKMWGGE